MRMRILTALAATALIALGAPAPAQATPGWLPDEAVVHATLVDPGGAVIAEPGDVVTLQWTQTDPITGVCGDGGGDARAVMEASYCAEVATADGQWVSPAPAGLPDKEDAYEAAVLAMSPAGADTEDGDTDYPAYDTDAVLADLDDAALASPAESGGVLYTAGSSPLAPTDLAVHVSDQRATSDDGTVYARIAAGLQDLWVPEEALTFASAEPSPASTEASAPALNPEAAETPTPEAQADADRGGGSLLLLGGLAGSAALLGAWVVLRRRAKKNHEEVQP